MADFNIGSGFNNEVYAITKVGTQYYVGGNFTTYNGVTANRICRINDDGSLDTTFSGGTGFNGIVRSIAAGPSSDIFVGAPPDF